MKEKKCVYCGKVFKTESPRQRQCDECRGKKKDDASAKRIKCEPLPIADCIKVLEKYNREHGTYYTYGNFPHKFLFYKQKGEKL